MRNRGSAEPQPPQQTSADRRSAFALGNPAIIYQWNVRNVRYQHRTADRTRPPITHIPLPATRYPHHVYAPATETTPFAIKADKLLAVLKVLFVSETKYNESSSPGKSQNPTCFHARFTESPNKSQGHKPPDYECKQHVHALSQI